LKVEKLVIGNTYYITLGNKARNFKVCTLVEIVGKKSVILKDKKGNCFRCSANRLHKSADKAVMGRKSKERAIQYMNEERQKKAERLVDKNIQNKIKQLGYSAYATMERDKYIVKGYEETKSFNTLGELENWADIQLAQYEATKERIIEKGYKHLCVTCKDGHKEYYTIINISFRKFEIFCKHFKGNIEDINEDKLLKREDVTGLRLKIHK